MKNVIQGTTLTGTGAVSVAPGAEITIRNPAGQLVPLWRDRDGTQEAGNPFYADNEGNFRVYADSGWVHVRAQKDGSVREWRYVPIGSAAAMDIGEVYAALGSEIYSSVSEGLSNSAEGDYFLVESSGSLDLYRVVNGVAEQRELGIEADAILATRAYADGVAAEAESNATNAAVAAASSAYQQATEYSDSGLQAHRESGDHDGRYYTKTEVDQALDGKVDDSDPRLSDARDWIAPMVTQAEVEGGESAEPRKWSVEMVKLAAETYGGSGSEIIGPGPDQVPTNEMLGTAARANIGTNPDDVPTNELLGTAAKVDVGTSPEQVPTNQLLGHVRPEGFGAVGDGVTDDAAALTAAFVAAAGGEIHLAPGKTYVSSTAQVLPEATTLQLNGATIKFTPDGEAKCLELRSRTRVLNGAIDCTGTNIAGEDNGDMHCPIIIGDYEGGAGYSDIVVDGVTITSNRENGNGIMVTGDSRNIVLRNLRFPDSATIGRPILLHWGGRNGGAPVATKHPHDIFIENIAIGKMTNNGTNASGIFLSAVYNVHVRNVHIEEAAVGIYPFAGDYGNTYASADEAPLVGRNILIENVSVMRARQHGLRIYGKSYIAQNLLPLPVVVRNFQASGNQANPAGVGILVEHAVRPVIERARLAWFEHGVRLGQETILPALRGVETYMTQRSGIVVDGGAGLPVENALIEHCYVTDFNTADATSGDDRAGILVGKARQVALLGNRTGKAAGETGHYGIRIASNAVFTRVSQNHVRGIRSGGVAYSIDGYVSVALGDNNTREGSITLFDGASIKQLLGGRYMWVDPTGKLRIDGNLPTSDTSGTVVGAQT